MSLQRSKIADIQTLASSAAALVACGAAQKIYLRGVILHNTNTTNETAELHLVPDASGVAGAASATNRFISAVLPANETVFIDLPYPIVLDEVGETIQGKTTTASKVTVILLGDKDA